MEPAIYPVSSASSRRAQSRGLSPSSKVPAGISRTRPRGNRCWFTMITMPSGSKARMAAAPGCSIISRVTRLPSISPSYTLRSRMRPRNLVWRVALSMMVRQKGGQMYLCAGSLGGGSVRNAPGLTSAQPSGARRGGL